MSSDETTLQKTTKCYLKTNYLYLQEEEKKNITATRSTSLFWLELVFQAKKLCIDNIFIFTRYNL